MTARGCHVMKMKRRSTITSSPLRSAIAIGPRQIQSGTRAAVKYRSKRSLCKDASSSHGQSVLVCSSARDDAALESWASEVGVAGIGERVRLARFSGGSENEDESLRGMISLCNRDACKEGEKDWVVRVPQPAALEVSSLKTSSVPSSLDKAGITMDGATWRELPWFAKLACLLAAEKRRGAQSPVAAYVATLPRSFDEFPMFWTDDELAELQYPPLEMSVHKQREEWTALASKIDADQDELVWAMLCVRSRCFSGPYEGSSYGSRIAQVVITILVAVASLYNNANGGGGDGSGTDVILAGGGAVILSILARDVVVSSMLGDRLKRYVMCPVIDHFNHSSKARSDIEYLYFQNAFELRVEAALHEGEQVFISYGEYANDALLQYYGFVEMSNPHDQVDDAALEALQRTSIEEDEARLEAALANTSVQGKRLRAALEFRLCKKKKLAESDTTKDANVASSSSSSSSSSLSPSSPPSVVSPS